MAAAADVAIVQQYMGSTYGTTEQQLADLDVRLARLGTAQAAALELLRTRRADFIAESAKLDVEGDASRDRTANLKYIDQLIGQLEEDPLATGGEVARSGAVTTTQLTRGSCRR